MTRLCIVSLSSDPAQFGGGYRAGTLVKYLAREGCELDLVSAEPGDRAVVGDFGRLTVVPYPARLRSRSLAWRLANRCTSWPEPERTWVKRALPVVLGRVTETLPDALIVSSPPHSAQLIGVGVGTATGVPFFADLRDDWVTNGRGRSWTPVQRVAAKRAERRVGETATRVFANTPILRAKLAERHSGHASKILVLPNGYDSAHFARPAEGPLVPGKLAIVYAGGGNGSYAVDEVRRLARALLSCGLAHTWRIVTAGFDEMPSPELSRVWRHLGILSPREAGNLMQRADLLLLLKPPGGPPPSSDVPLKTYSYLRSGSPVLYLGEAGAASDLLGQFDGVFMVARDQRTRLVNWLSQHEAELRRRPRFTRPGIEEYDFSAISRRLMDAVRESLATRHETHSAMTRTGAT